MCFDLSVYDLFGALAAGAALVLIDDQRDVEDVIYTIEHQGITIWNSVPAIMEMVLASVTADFHNDGIREVLLSGDWIPLQLPEKIKRHCPHAEVISLGEQQKPRFGPFTTQSRNGIDRPPRYLMASSWRTSRCMC